MPGPGYREPYGEPDGFEGYIEEQSGGPGILGCLLVVLALALATVAILFYVILFSGGSGSYVSATACEAPPGTDYVSSEPSAEAVSDIPGNYYDLYKQAAEEYNLDWAILAAVGKIETDHGRLDAPGVTSGSNTNGCCAGPMQFDINNYNTWAQVGYDANGDGKTDVYDPEDAIPSAAKYLVQGGAPEDYQSALYQYNNAQWYVDDVMAQADKYRSADAGSGGGGSGETGTTPAVLSPFISPAYAQEGGGSNEGSSEGSGEPPQGWDLVDNSERTLYYELQDTSFKPEFEAAVEEWNALGGVEIAPTPPGEQTDVRVFDASLNGNLGYASSDGTIRFDPAVAEGIGTSARKTAALHELGHALGFDHTTEDSVMTERVAVGERNVSSPTEYDRQLYKQVWGSGGTEGGTDGSGTEASGSATSPAPGQAPQDCQPRGGGGPGSGGPGGGGEGQVEGTASGKAVLEEARKYDGVAYDIYSCQPGELMDCSCLTMTVFEKFGLKLPWPVMEQRNYGEPVEGEPQAGDLIVYEPGGGYPGHVGIANGEGGIFHCASPGLGCLESPDYRTAGPSPVLDIRRLVDEGGGSG